MASHLRLKGSTHLQIWAITRIGQGDSDGWPLSCRYNPRALDSVGKITNELEGDHTSSTPHNSSNHQTAADKQSAIHRVYCFYRAPLSWKK
jgi:hypothetical protein